MTDGRVTALIVDDEPIARAGLRRLLREVEWIHCVGEAANAAEAREAIASLRPELLLLDIEMPEGSGIDMLRSLDRPPFVIFTTAWSQYAVTAFELGALDYLLKPFGAERLAASLERARAALGESGSATADRLAEAFSRGPMSRLFVRHGRAITPILVADVRYFEAVGDYVAAHVGGAQHLVHVALHRLEERLVSDTFVRIHRRTLVNLSHVRGFRRPLVGGLVVELVDGAHLPVSRNQARKLRALIE